MVKAKAVVVDAGTASENGKIVGCGGQEELLLKCPLYQRLWSDYVSSADQVEGGKV